MGCGSSSTSVQTIKIEPDHSRRNSRQQLNNHVTEEKRSNTPIASTTSLDKKRRSSTSSSSSKKSIGSYYLNNKEEPKSTETPSTNDNKQETRSPEPPYASDLYSDEKLKDLDQNTLENNNTQNDVDHVQIEHEEPEPQVLNLSTGDNEFNTETIKAEEDHHEKLQTEESHDQSPEEETCLRNVEDKSEGNAIPDDQTNKSTNEALELRNQNSTSTRITQRQKPQPNPFGPVSEPQEDRWAKHERIALEKEERRSKYDFDMREEILLNDFSPIDMPAMDEIPEQSVPTYTTLDIQAHNMDHPRDWFKFGRKIYSNYKFWPIVKGRAEEYNAVVNGSTITLTTESVMNPVMTARGLGVPRKVVRQLLPCCLVGIYVDVPEEYLSSIKEGVEGILEDLDDGEDMPESKYVQEYKQQLMRWLASYPNNKGDNKLNDYSMDPNEIVFPLPAEILNAPNVLRQWIETYEPFDTEVPEEGAWVSIKAGILFETNEDVIEPEPAEELAELDLTIDGNVAWSSIDTDLFKNDITTSEQDEIWKLRETRTNLNDTKWMASRRHAIGDSLTVRHEWEPHIVVPYLKCCDNLEESWKTFQELCEKEFVPRPVDINSDSGNSQNEANADIMRIDDDGIQRNQPPPPELETKDSGLDLTSSEPLEQENDNSARDREESVGRPTSETTDVASNQAFDT